MDGAHFNDGFHVNNKYSKNTDVGTVPQLLLKSGVFNSPDKNPKLDIYNVTAAHGDPFPVRDGNVGVPMIHSVISIFKPGTQEELTYNTPGEICMTGPGVMLGYDRPEATAKALQVHADGKTWLHTGDIGYMDEDGFVYLDSRIKRLIIRHDGFKVFPSMIENVISQHPAVHQCSVVGCTDKDHVQGRLPFVYIVLDPEAAVSVKKRQVIKELRQLCTEELPEYVQPVGYKFIDSMPMTPVGKFDYRKLEEEITSRDY